MIKSPANDRLACEQCNKHFKTGRTLRAHTRRMHPSEFVGLGVVDVKEDDDDVVRVNPVFDIDIMNISAEDFSQCRMTPDGRISVLDAIEAFMGKSRPASDYWYDLSRKNSSRENPVTVSFQFPGERQRQTPVAYFKDILVILSQLPGPKARALRDQQANLSSRAVAGDRDLEEALPAQRARMAPEVQAIAMAGLPSAVRNPLEDKEKQAKIWKIVSDTERANIEFMQKMIVSSSHRQDERDAIFARDIERQMHRNFARDFVSGNFHTFFNQEQPPRIESSEGPKREISIPLIAQQMGIRVNERGSQVGKLMVKLWRAKHGHDSSVQPPKRETLFRGRPYQENTYFDDDADIMQEALQQVCQ